tara:strand:- start:72 stop:452 length:381 start_codon:yes stop_codon:yes gene_type:complete
LGNKPIVLSRDIYKYGLDGVLKSTINEGVDTMKPKINDKILFFWNTEGETDINKTNGHYPYEAEIITISAEDEDYYYDDNATVEIAKTDGDKKPYLFCKVEGVDNLWLQTDNQELQTLSNKYVVQK